MKNPKNWTAAAFLAILTGCLCLVLAGVVLESAPAYEPGEAGPTYTGVVKWFEDTCRTFCTTALPGQVQLKEANAAVNRLAGKWIFESTDVVRLRNGHLTNAGFFRYEKSRPWEAVSDFRDYVETELGVPYLYVQAPCKLCALDDQLPMEGMSDQNEAADLLLGELAEQGVDALDLRQALHGDGLDHYASFFRTDHHWTPDTGLWAARTMAEDLAEQYGLDMDCAALAEENYTRRTWEGVFLGSWGRKVTRVCAQPEDFVLPVPVQPVRMRLTRYGQEYEGGFEALYDESAIVPEDYYTSNSYGALLRGDCGYIKVENLDRPEGPVVAVLRESFAGAAGPYLALASGELHLLDARYYDGSIQKLLAEIQPDVVLSLLNVQCHTGAYFDMMQ